jgi:hypothetical protein
MSDIITRAKRITKQRTTPLIAKQYTCKCCWYLDNINFYVSNQLPCITREDAEFYVMSDKLMDALLGVAEAATNVRDRPVAGDYTLSLFLALARLEEIKID